MKGLRMNTKLFTCISIIGIIIICMSFMSSILGVYNFGSMVLLIVGMLIIIAAYMERYKDKLPFHYLHYIKNAIWFILILGLLLFIYCSFLIAFGKNEQKEPIEDQTVVVLGCQIYDDRPSLMLEARLNIALEILENNPKTECVVCGGMGKDEQYTEAEVMKKYLVNQGIMEDRIYLEDQSVNTIQNIEYAKQVINANHLSREVIIVTSDYHSYRSVGYAKKNGLEATSKSANTRLFLLPSSWMREVFSVLKFVVWST